MSRLTRVWISDSFEDSTNSCCWLISLLLILFNSFLSCDSDDSFLLLLISVFFFIWNLSSLPFFYIFIFIFQQKKIKNAPFWGQILGLGSEMKINDFAKAWKGFAKDEIHIGIQKNGLTSFQTISEMGHSSKYFSCENGKLFLYRLKINKLMW